MAKIKDLAGQVFGRLTVIEPVGKNKYGNYLWKCRCACGNEIVACSKDLRSGDSKSCGCLKLDKLIQRTTTHGFKHSRIYNIWCGMKERCYNPNFKQHDDYGGRGISICDEWKDDFQSFYDYVSKLENFGEVGYTLDRIDNEGNYELGNVRWITQKEQNRNQRTNVIVEYDGENICLKEAAEKSGLNYGSLRGRYKRGDRGERLFRPVRKYKK